MSQLEFPDRHHLNAAVGWLELRAFKDAAEELEKIDPAHRAHPEVLDLRWHLHAGSKEWEAALTTAKQQVEVEPFAPAGWIQQSYALHEMNRTDEALAELERVVERFPDIGTIPYNLACYNCRLGRLEEARTWLRRACRIQGGRETILLATDDPDLAAIRDELNKFPRD
jgi:tetratricopeptide (TPR) repeat protein